MSITGGWIVFCGWVCLWFCWWFWGGFFFVGDWGMVEPMGAGGVPYSGLFWLTKAKSSIGMPLNNVSASLGSLL